MNKSILKKLLTVLFLSATICMMGGAPVQCITRTFSYGDLAYPNLNTPSAIEQSSTGNGFIIDSNGSYFLADPSGIKPITDNSELGVKNAPIEDVPVDAIKKYIHHNFISAIKSSTHLFGRTKDGDIYSVRLAGINREDPESAIRKLGNFKDVPVKKIIPSLNGENVCVLLEDGSLWIYDSSRKASPLVEYKDIDGVVDAVYVKDINQFAAATDENKVYTTDSNGKWNTICESSTGTITSLATNGRNIAITTEKALIVATPSASSVTVTPELVGPAAGRPNDAIYRVTITGLDLSASNVFGNGYNGIRYIVSDLQDSSYTKDAYPLSGIKYTDDAQNTASFLPNPISFLWIGPKSTANSPRQLNIEERVSNMNTKAGVSFSTAQSPLPDFEETYTAFDPSVYTIAIDQTTHYTIANGVCATPFSVTVYKNGNLISPDSDEGKNVYSRIVFYATDSLQSQSIKNDGIAGADPLFKTANKCAILPANNVELSPNIVKYGRSADDMNVDTQGGSIYYLFTTSNSSVSIVAGFIDGSGQLSGNSSYLTTMPFSSSTSLSASPSIDDNSTSTISFAGSGWLSESVEGSSWLGGGVGHCNGYFDYVLESKGTNSAPESGIYFVFPEGYGSRNLDDRFNFSNMKPSYYAQPAAISSTSDINTPSYTLQATPKWSDSLRSLTKLYLILFDRYGRMGSLSVTPDSTTPQVLEPGDTSTGTTYNPWNIDNNTQDNDENARCVVVYLNNFYSIPVIIRSETVTDPSKLPSVEPKFDRLHFGNKGVTYTGIVVPGNTRNIAFMSDVYAIIDNYNDGMSSMAGYQVCTGAQVFKTYLGIDEDNASGTFNFKMTANIDDEINALTSVMILNVGSEHYRIVKYGVGYMPTADAYASVKNFQSWDTAVKSWYSSHGYASFNAELTHLNTSKSSSCSYSSNASCGTGTDYHILFPGTFFGNNK